MKVAIIALALLHATYGVIEQRARRVRGLPGGRGRLLVVGRRRITIAADMRVGMVMVMVEWINIAIVAKTSEQKDNSARPCDVNAVFTWLIQSDEIVIRLATRERGFRHVHCSRTDQSVECNLQVAQLHSRGEKRLTRFLWTIARCHTYILPLRRRVATITQDDSI